MRPLALVNTQTPCSPVMDQVPGPQPASHVGHKSSAHFTVTGEKEGISQMKFFLSPYVHRKAMFTVLQLVACVLALQTGKNERPKCGARVRPGKVIRVRTL